MYNNDTLLVVLLLLIIIIGMFSQVVRSVICYTGSGNEFEMFSSTLNSCDKVKQGKISPIMSLAFENTNIFTSDIEKRMQILYFIR